MRYKKFIISILVISLSIFGLVPPRIETGYAGAIPLTAASVVLMDNSGLIYARTPYAHRAAASTVKILTAMVAMDQLRLNQVVTISPYAVKVEPSKIHLRAGDQFLVSDLIKATLINSANDAAEALAFAAAGSRADFARLMNRKARSIGCRRSNFIRASGLPAPGHYTTAYDMALISRAAQNYPFLDQTLKIKTCVIRSQGGRRIYLRNHNRYLWRRVQPVVGKTGWTRAAKHCFVGHVEMGARKVFLAMLGSRRLWRDLQALAAYAFGTSYRRDTNRGKPWGRHDVKKVQTALLRAGFDPGPADGVMGPATVTAVRRFQRASGLPQTGNVGTKTWNKLEPHL